MSSEMLLADNYLRTVHSRGKRSLPLKRVYRNMRRRGLFLKAYANLYANDGATTIGTDPQDTIQGMSLARIDKIIAQLREGSYQWKASRRVYIPKSKGGQRPIAVPNSSDKLVQEVMRMTLDAYYEPEFRNSSHGFRTGRGCHTALLEVKRKWTAMKWCIEGDIKGCFDNLDHETIIKLLSRQIHDRRFLKLVRSMLRAGYLDNWTYHENFSGTPQGGVISPLLSNLVLHELDVYIEDVLLPQFSQGKRRRHNPAYYQLSREKLRARQQGDVEHYRHLDRQQRRQPEGDPHDPRYKRLRYVRYADDFLLGLIGSKTEARTIKAQVGEYLRSLHLTMSPNKTYITHASTKAARFLGYEIVVAKSDCKMAKGKDGIKRRAVNGIIQLRVPKDVRNRWAMRYTKHGSACHIGGYLELSDYEIVATYGAQLRGLVNYYSLANNIGTSLRWVRWVCMESARKTLMMKHKMRSPRQAFKRYYHDRTSSGEWRHLQAVVKREKQPPLIAKCGETPLRTRKMAPLTDKLPPKVIAGTSSELLTRLLKGECELCGGKADLEAHHINKLKHLRKRWQGRRAKPLWVQKMLARRRKTLVVCHACHQSITHGKYDGVRVNKRTTGEPDEGKLSRPVRRGAVGNTDHAVRWPPTLPDIPQEEPGPRKQRCSPRWRFIHAITPWPGIVGVDIGSSTQPHGSTWYA